MTENQATKRNPGEWLRYLILERLTASILFAMMSVSWFLAVGLIWLSQSYTFLMAPVLIYFILAPGIVFTFTSVWFSRRGWNVQHMLKGARSEARIGHAIEYSITREACAVAHNVIGIASRGDIDHLVVTPGGLWVIETKSTRYGLAERHQLEELAEKVKDVRNWTPFDTRVFGCLVYANDAGPQGDSIQQISRESIRTYRSRKSLSDALRLAVQEKAEEEDLANKVWGLSVDEQT